MKLEGNCLTTAMGIMPHTDTDRALELALAGAGTMLPDKCGRGKDCR